MKCLIVRMRCRHKNCKIFKLCAYPKNVITDATLDLHFFEFGIENHVGKLAEPVTGLKKIRVVQKIVKTTPRLHVLKATHDLSPSKILSGNLGEKISDSYARKLRSRGLAENDFVIDDYEDLKQIQMAQAIKNETFVQHIFEEPFHVILINEINLKLLAAKEGFDIENCTLHIDATGSVVRKLFDSQKQIYFYSICIRCPPVNIRDPGTLIELASMISSSHTQITIGNFLSIFKMKLVQIFKKWPVFKDAVSDFSYATVNAMLLNFNSNTLTDYLQNKFNMLNNISSNKVPLEIHLCAAHFMKNFINILKTYKFGKTESRHLKQIFGRFFTMHDWADLQRFLRLFIELLSNPTANASFCKTFDSIKKYVASLEYSEQPDQENTADDILKMKFYETENEKSTKSIYKNSPFYALCNEIQKEVAGLLQKNKQTEAVCVNRYYSVELLEELKKKMFAFLPLWINITNDPSKVSRLS